MSLAPLERLPVEVFEIIAADLDLPAYNATRLTSGSLHLLSLSIYAKRYFSELTTTLGSASLDRLVNIASHSHFCSIATVLDIRLLNHRDYKTLVKIQRVGINPPPKRFPKVPGVRVDHIGEESTLYADISTAKYPSCITDRLTRILDGLPNLHTLRFRAMRSEPLGWATSSMPEGDQAFRSRCFQAVVQAVIKSEVALKDFGLAKGRKGTSLNKQANLPFPTLNLPLPTLLALRHHFSELETLSLSITSDCLHHTHTPGWENGISQIISIAPTTKHLSLSLDPNSSVSRYSAAIMRSLALSCRLTDLQSFHLVNSSVRAEEFSTFLVAHANALSQLVCSDIRLLSGSWVDIWTTLKGLQHLQYLRLASLRGTAMPLLFERRRNLRLAGKITLDSKKTGKMMAHLLTELISGYTVDDDSNLVAAHMLSQTS